MGKVCSRCANEKPLSDFSPHPTSLYGVRPDCRVCRAAYNRAWRIANSEKATAISRAAGRKFDAANREKRAAAAAARRERIKQDPVLLAAERVKRQQANRSYYLRHPEKIRMHDRKRKARIRGVEHAPYNRTAIFERDSGVCRGCGQQLVNEPNGFTLDHIVPLALGGPDIAANLQVMCRSCNCSKRASLEGQIHMPM